MNTEYTFVLIGKGIRGPPQENVMNQLKKRWVLLRLFAKRWPVLAITLGVGLMIASLLMGSAVRNNYLDVALSAISIIGVQLLLFGANYA